jgi:hypothetical protein
VDGFYIIIKKDNNMHIFVSYTTKDAIISKSFLLSVSNTLTFYGKPFIDLLHNDSPNRQFRINQELHSADILLFLNSASAKHSKWVKWELKQAQDLDLHVIPIGVDNYMNPDQLGRIIKEEIETYSKIKRIVVP